MGAIFVKAAYKDTCNMVKVKEDGEEKWVNCSKAAKAFARNNFKEGDEVNLVYEGDVVSKVEKVGGSSTTTPKDTETKTNFRNYSGEYQKPKDPIEVASIKSQAIGHMTSRALIALQGHVNPNNVESLAEILYRKFETLVG